MNNYNLLHVDAQFTPANLSKAWEKAQQLEKELQQKYEKKLEENKVPAIVWKLFISVHADLLYK